MLSMLQPVHVEPYQLVRFDMVRLKLGNPLSQVEHYNTEPLCSYNKISGSLSKLLQICQLVFKSKI